MNIEKLLQQHIDNKPAHTQRKARTVEQMLKGHIEYCEATCKYADSGDLLEILLQYRRLKWAFVDLMEATGCEHEEKVDVFRDIAQ